MQLPYSRQSAVNTLTNSFHTGPPAANNAKPTHIENAEIRNMINGVSVFELLDAIFSSLRKIGKKISMINK